MPESRPSRVVGARTGGTEVPCRLKPAPLPDTLRLLVGLNSINSGQGSASPASSEPAGFALLFDDTVLPGRVYGPGRLPACARFLGGVERPANLFRLGRLDRCAGSTRKRLEQNGLLSSSGAPSWGAKPDPTSRTGPRKPEGRYLGQFLPPERGSNVAGQQETQPTD